MKFNPIMLFIVALTLSCVMVTWNAPTEGSVITHGNKAIALEINNNGMVGAVTYNFLWSSDDKTNTSIISGTSTNQTWVPPETAVGSTALSVVASNSSGTTSASTIHVTIKAFSVADLTKVVIDFVVTYAAQFVALAGLIALIVIAGFFFRKTRGLGL